MKETLKYYKGKRTPKEWTMDMNRQPIEEYIKRRAHIEDTQNYL